MRSRSTGTCRCAASPALLIVVLCVGAAGWWCSVVERGGGAGRPGYWSPSDPARHGGSRVGSGSGKLLQARVIWWRVDMRDWSLGYVKRKATRLIFPKVDAVDGCRADVAATRDVVDVHPQETCELRHVRNGLADRFCDGRRF